MLNDFVETSPKELIQAADLQQQKQQNTRLFSTSKPDKAPVYFDGAMDLSEFKKNHPELELKEDSSISRDMLNRLHLRIPYIEEIMTVDTNKDGKITYAELKVNKGRPL